MRRLLRLGCHRTGRHADAAALPRDRLPAAAADGLAVAFPLPIARYLQTDESGCFMQGGGALAWLALPEERRAQHASDPTLLSDPSGYSPFGSFSLLNCIGAIFNQLALPALEQLVYFVPFVGSAIFVIDGFTHTNIFTGQRLSTGEANVDFALGLTGLLGDVLGQFEVQDAEAVSGVFAEAADAASYEAGAEDAAAGLDTGTATAESGAAGGASSAASDIGSASGDPGAGGAVGDAGGSGVGGDTGSGGCGGGMSFRADTPVATPNGMRPIGSLKPGDLVEAYNPQTGKTEAKPIQYIWRTQDTDLLDVTLRLTPATTTAATAGAAPAPSGANAAGRSTNRATSKNATNSQPQRALRMLPGVRSLMGSVVAAVTFISLVVGVTAGATLPTSATVANVASATLAGSTETIHTTANHPWLTADRGWVIAGALRSGEAVVTLDGQRGVVVTTQAVAGHAAMDNLTVADDHTYAVGSGQWVVHNDDPIQDIPQFLYHYTKIENIPGIFSEGLRPSIAVPNAARTDAQWGNGVYFTDIAPAEAEQGNMGQLTRALFNSPHYWGTKTRFDIVDLKVNVTGLNVERVTPVFSDTYGERSIYLLRTEENVPILDRLARGSVETVYFKPFPHEGGC